MTRESLTAAELSLIPDINASTPFNILVEDQPITMQRADELSRQYSARGNGRLVSAAGVSLLGGPRLRQGAA